MPECGNLYISGVVAVCAVLVCFPTDFRASCRFGFVRGKVVPVCRNGFGFRCKTYGASKRLSSRRGAGGFDRYFFVPGVLRGLCGFIATRALFPMLVFVLLPTGGGEIVPECGNLYISGVVAVCAVLVCFPTDFRASCRFGFVRGKVVPVCRNGFGFRCKTYGASKRLSSRRGAGGFDRYFFVPGVLRGLCGFIATRAFLPMAVFVLLPYAACEIVPVSGYFYICRIIAVGTLFICFPTYCRTSGVSCIVLCNVVTFCGNGFGFCFKASGASIGFYACCRASRRKRYFIFPSMCRGLVCSFTTRAFFPMVGFVLLPYVACKIMP